MKYFLQFFKLMPLIYLPLYINYYLFYIPVCILHNVAYLKENSIMGF